MGDNYLWLGSAWICRDEWSLGQKNSTPSDICLWAQGQGLSTSNTSSRKPTLPNGPQQVIPDSSFTLQFQPYSCFVGQYATHDKTLLLKFATDDPV